MAQELSIIRWVSITFHMPGTEIQKLGKPRTCPQGTRPGGADDGIKTPHQSVIGCKISGHRTFGAHTGGTSDLAFRASLKMAICTTGPSSLRTGSGFPSFWNLVDERCWMFIEWLKVLEEILENSLCVWGLPSEGNCFFPQYSSSLWSGLV